MSQTQQLPVIAGYNDNNDPVVEQVSAIAVEGHPDQFRLQKSPVFVRGLASGDLIRYPADNTGGYELLEHSGNLSIRVFSKHNIAELDQALTPDIELIDGTRDVCSPGVLIYSVHVSIGFKKIEEVITAVLKRFPESVWYYGNVYDPEDGQTPLNWWQDLASSV
ncbi:MAG TPA: phosphotyrosine protein phosphatase [Pseudohongiella sp.]|nr:phosphotyrosine protein phosphatase [Pseudohongiella sp.]HBX36627.1 phosphotyrosine protein phosphatase [Pseudohongiella sp.]|tara:strand:- start:860 stop:1351 length:492 start_codon:yes stop_codon:yes gene_type:complete